MKWVKLKKYCELSGDTASAVHTRRNRGIWLDGVESRVGPDGNLWINVKEVDRWIEQGFIASQSGLKSCERTFTCFNER
jgi:hypothetical protein